jgi:hypothetical protein
VYLGAYLRAINVTDEANADKAARATANATCGGSREGGLGGSGGLRGGAAGGTNVGGRRASMPAAAPQQPPPLQMPSTAARAVMSKEQCKHCKVVCEMVKAVVSSTNRKGNAGIKYVKCVDCGGFQRWGSW